jgi:glucose-6-phosphate dehydrogenase assembly protein OpcA
VAAALTTVAEIERELAELRGPNRQHVPHQRTSVMTHLAWVPEEWVDAAHDVLAGLAERHPSRTIVLVPQPDADRDEIDGEVRQQCFPLAGSTRQVCTETIELRLLGNRASRPASIVQPLLISDLPVFCRWRGEPPWDGDELAQLVGIADRLVVDSREWREPVEGYKRLVEIFDRVAVSDIAWSLTYDWRLELSKLWPTIAEQEVRLRGPQAQASLLRGWLVSRLHRPIRPVEPADELGVQLGGERLAAPRTNQLSPADLLSNELDRFSRDRVYEHAVRATAS